MSEPLMSNQFETAPSLGRQFSDRIDLKFNELGATLPLVGGERDHEQSARLLPTTVLDECPTARAAIATRPIPGQEQLAAEKWSYFGGPRVSVYEAGGQIETTYRVAGDEILKRRITRFPDEEQPRADEDSIAYHLRRGAELLDDALALSALDPDSRASIVRARDHGEPIEAEEAQRLLAWLDSSITEAA